MLSRKKQKSLKIYETVSQLSNLGKIPKPKYWFGDVIRQTFIYKENNVVIVETAKIIGLYFHPVKKKWEYMVYWITSSDPEDIRPMFEETPIAFLDEFEDKRVKILVASVTPRLSPGVISALLPRYFRLWNWK